MHQVFCRAKMLAQIVLEMHRSSKGPFAVGIARSGKPLDLLCGSRIPK